VSLVTSSDQVARALARVLEQHKSNPDLIAILTSWAAQAQALEDAFWDLFTQWGLDATGARLDQTGRILDEPRDGDTDDVYVVRLRAKVRALQSSGSYQDFIDVWKLLNPNNLARFTSSGGSTGASFAFEIGNILSQHVAINQRFLELIRSAGVDGQLTYELTDEGHCLVLADSHGVIVTGGAGFGDALSPGTGGALGGALT
jgi:hypothetical protein